MAKTTEKRRTTTTSVPGSAGLPPSPRLRRTAVASAEAGQAGRAKRRLSGDVGKAVRAALDKKAQDVVVLDLRHTPAFTDHFVLCTGLNVRQVKAITDAIEETLRAAKVRPSHIEGYERAEWVLMDYFTFVVHVFTPSTRAFYALDRLWGDAERIEVTDQGAKGA